MLADSHHATNSALEICPFLSASSVVQDYLGMVVLVHCNVVVWYGIKRRGQKFYSRY